MDTMTHAERMANATACKPVDRTAYINFASELLGKYGNEEFTAGDMYTRPEWAIDQVLKGAKRMGGDTIPSYVYGPLFESDPTGTYYLTPGKDLPADETFQAIETNPLKEEHIDFILENGVQAWMDKYVVPNFPDWAEEGAEEGGRIAGLMEQKAAETGEGWVSFPIPDYMGPIFYSMARGFQESLIDAYTEPETTKKIVDMLNEWNLEYTANFYKMVGAPMPAVCPALGRLDDRTLGPDVFDEVFWPSIKRCIEYADDKGIPLIAHVDGYWDKMLDRHIDEFTPHNTIIQLDGFTDPFKLAPKFVERGICLMGDIPPMMLVDKDPQPTYDRVIKLRQSFGDGLILAAGCQSPPNTTFENIQAFVEAARTPNF
ncbi:MAG: uroporphyrinogen decarboxylase family protein [Coriobacteriales bacterium]